jgi:hypothetical protein
MAGGGLLVAVGTLSVSETKQQQQQQQQQYTHTHTRTHTRTHTHTHTKTHTHTHAHTHCPLVFQVDNPEMQRLRLVVRDDDLGWGDKVLGVAEVPLREVRWQEYGWKMRHKVLGGVGGETAR